MPDIQSLPRPRRSCRKDHHRLHENQLMELFNFHGRASTSLPNSSKIATPPCGRYKLICAVALVNVCTQPLRKLASDRQAKPRSIDRLWMLMTPRLRFQRRHLGLNPAVDLYSMPNMFRFKSSSLLSMQMNLFCFVRQLVQKRDAFYADDHEWHGARTLRAYDEK